MDDLQNMFNRAGLVMSASIALDSKGGSQGYGFVTMSNEDGVQAAIRIMNGFTLHDRSITVREAHANE
jgi:RNA recognition motif-containing protein